MKKTFSISISGIVFHIEEDAFDKLHRYLETIKSHFHGFEGRDELIADIESRIAEILQKKITDSKQVITLEDVDEVVAIMGQPTDYILEDDPGKGQTGEAYIHQPKRLYRDPDQRILGGVCSGVASYFMIDPIWIRLIFIILAFSGFGIVLYIIMWLVVPEARSRSERLEMRGQQVNIWNIEQSLKEEVHHVKDSLNDLTTKAKVSYRSGMENFGNRRGGGISGGLNAILRVVGRITMILIGFVIFLLGLMLSLAFLAILFKNHTLTPYGSVGPFPLYPALDMIFLSHADLRTFSTAILLVIGIPLLLMLWAGIRMIFRLPRVKYLGRIAALVWFLFLMVALFYGLKTARSYRYQGESVKESILSTHHMDTIHLVTKKNLPDRPDNDLAGDYYFREWRLVITDQDNNFHGIPWLRIIPGPDSTSRLVTIARARGWFRDEADEMAGKINYNWDFSGDTLIFSDSYMIPKDDKWREQEMGLKLYLPPGTVVTIDDNSKRILSGDNQYSRFDMAGNMFVMGQQGIRKTITP